MSLPEKLRHFALRSEDQEAAVMREAADEIDRVAEIVRSQNLLLEGFREQARQARRLLKAEPSLVVPDQLDVPIGELRAYVEDAPHPCQRCGSTTWTNVDYGGCSDCREPNEDEEIARLTRERDMWEKRALTMQKVALFWIEHARQAEPDLFPTEYLGPG